MTPILTQLKEIAGKATPGPWTVYTPLAYITPGIEAANGKTIVVYQGGWDNDDGGVRTGVSDALHIATFNPETTGKLLDALEYALSVLEDSIDDHDGFHPREVKKILSTINLPTK